MRKISTVSYVAHMAVFMVVGKLFKIFALPDWQNVLHFAVTLIVTHILALMIIKLSDCRYFKFLRFFQPILFLQFLQKADGNDPN
jgi:hypothetical protein